MTRASCLHCTICNETDSFVKTPTPVVPQNLILVNWLPVDWKRLLPNLQANTKSKALCIIPHRSTVLFLSHLRPSNLIRPTDDAFSPMQVHTNGGYGVQCLSLTRFSSINLVQTVRKPLPLPIELGKVCRSSKVHMAPGFPTILPHHLRQPASIHWRGVFVSR